MELSEFDDQEGLRARSEQAIGELAQALLDSNVLENAVAAAFGAREKALEAQQAAMSGPQPALGRRRRAPRAAPALASRSGSKRSRTRSTGSAREIGGVRRQVAAEAAAAEKAED